MQKSTNSVLLLASGGIDSTACIQYYQDLGFEIKCVFIDYGQNARFQERNSVKSICSHYQVKLQILQYNFHEKYPIGEIKGRNAFLIFAALLANPKFSGLLSLGIHSGPNYYDCSKNFVNEINKILTGYLSGQLVFDAPLLDFNKKMIIKYCKTKKVPLHLTYSCEKGSSKPCGTCMSCLDREGLNVV
jgi:7-cyano-7-deazaguanine synthase